MTPQQISSLESRILSGLQMLWRDRVYTRENSDSMIHTILREESLTDANLLIKVKSLGGEDGFSVKVSVKNENKE